MQLTSLKPPLAPYWLMGVTSTEQKTYVPKHLEWQKMHKSKSQKINNNPKPLPIDLCQRAAVRQRAPESSHGTPWKLLIDMKPWINISTMVTNYGTTDQPILVVPHQSPSNLSWTRHRVRCGWGLKLTLLLCDGFLKVFVCLCVRGCLCVCVCHPLFQRGQHFNSYNN